MIRAWLKRAVDFLFGYDFFISYAHDDGLTYPRNLRKNLEILGYKVFLDEQGFMGGENLSIATRHRVRTSSSLLLVALPAAITVSKWVLMEVQLFVERGRNPIIIDVRKTLATIQPQTAMADLILERLTFPETLGSGADTPSDDVLQNIVRSFHGTRQQTRRIYALSVASLFFLVIGGLALWQWHEAEVQRRISDAMALDAKASQHFSEAGRIDSVWDREWARQLELENEVARLEISSDKFPSGSPSHERNISEPFSDESQTERKAAALESPRVESLRLDSLRNEIAEIVVLRKTLTKAARVEREEARKLVAEASTAWTYASSLNGTSLTHRQLPNLPRLFSVEVLSVGFGESLILHYGDPDSPKFLVIDGGQPRTYDRALGPRLALLKQNWSPANPLPIEYVIISNQDNDRLGGIISMLRQLRDKSPATVALKNIWYESFGPGNASGQKALARQLIEQLGLPLNKPFPTNVTRPVRGTVNLNLDEDLTATILNPTFEDIGNLYNWWEKQAVEKGEQSLIPPTENYENVPGAIVNTDFEPSISETGCVDKSIANRASHVLLFSYHGKSFLHGGDACSTQIETGLRAAGFTAKDGSFKVDLMLIPHQGSDNNVSRDFFRRIKADQYLFTGDGTHNNPELATLQMVLEAREGENYTFQFLNRDGQEGFGEKLDTFFAAWSPEKYGYRRVFRSQSRGAMTIDLLDRVRY
jgi:hypothetical protein